MQQCRCMCRTRENPTTMTTNVSVGGGGCRPPLAYVQDRDTIGNMIGDIRTNSPMRRAAGAPPGRSVCLHSVQGIMRAVIGRCRGACARTRTLRPPPRIQTMQPNRSILAPLPSSPPKPPHPLRSLPSLARHLAAPTYRTARARLVTVLHPQCRLLLISAR